MYSYHCLIYFTFPKIIVLVSIKNINVDFSTKILVLLSNVTLLTFKVNNNVLKYSK